MHHAATMIEIDEAITVARWCVGVAIALLVTVAMATIQE